MVLMVGLIGEGGDFAISSLSGNEDEFVFWF